MRAAGLVVAVVGGLVGCYAPMGPLGHRPDLLFNLPMNQLPAIPGKPVSGPPLVIPMFSSQMTYPTGGFYNLQRSEIGPLAHTYASREPEAAFTSASLRRCVRSAMTSSGTTIRDDCRCPVTTRNFAR